MTEDGIMERLAGGDEDAWREVFPLLFSDALKVCLRHSMLGLVLADAEDVAMETLSEVASEVNLESLSTVDDLRRFTRTMALRRGIDYVRRVTAKKRGSGEVDSLDEPVGESELRLDRLASACSVRKSVALLEFLEKLDDLLADRLNDKEREMFRLFYVEQLSQKEIVEKMGVPIGSVGATLKRALDKLKAGLSEEGLSPEDFLS